MKQQTHLSPCLPEGDQFDRESLVSTQWKCSIEIDELYEEKISLLEMEAESLNSEYEYLTEDRRKRVADEREIYGVLKSIDDKTTEIDSIKTERFLIVQQGNYQIQQQKIFIEMQDEKQDKII